MTTAIALACTTPRSLHHVDTPLLHRQVPARAGLFGGPPASAHRVGRRLSSPYARPMWRCPIVGLALFGTAQLLTNFAKKRVTSFATVVLVLTIVPRSNTYQYSASHITHRQGQPPTPQIHWHIIAIWELASPLDSRRARRPSVPPAVAIAAAESHVDTRQSQSK